MQRDLEFDKRKETSIDVIFQCDNEVAVKASVMQVKQFSSPLYEHECVRGALSCCQSMIDLQILGGYPFHIDHVYSSATAGLFTI